MPQNNFPKLHNAAWPGLVGKGSPGAEPFIPLDTMLDLTAQAEVNGQKFDGIDLFLSSPHTDIDSSDDELKKLADKLKKRNLAAGSLVAPVWGGTGGGSAMGSDDDRKKFVDQVRYPGSIQFHYAEPDFRSGGERLYSLLTAAVQGEHSLLRREPGVRAWRYDGDRQLGRIVADFLQVVRQVWL